MKFKLILAVLLGILIYLPAQIEAKDEKCADVKVLMYHHIEEAKAAKEKNQTGLNVTPEFFDQHLKYLRENGYAVIGLGQLAAFLETGAPIPKKSAMITFDDAYEDNYLDMFPILKKYDFRAIIFTPMGLIENSDYLKWSQIEEMKQSGLVAFANHTWSHYPSYGTKEKQEQEIGDADKLLIEKDLDTVRAFAYPYGRSSENAKQILQEMGYKLAFTTRQGSEMCPSARFDLPRIRVGNASLSGYGL